MGHLFITQVPFYGFAIVCIDDPSIRKIVNKITTANIITYGETENSDIQSKKIRHNSNGVVFNVELKKINKTIKNIKTNISKKHSAFSKTIQKNFLDCKIKINKQEEKIQKEILKNLTPITVEVVKKISLDTISIKKNRKSSSRKTV
jgi:UDP-N-acetylmuramate-alanine ligase